MIDNLVGQGQFPISTTGTLFKTGGSGSVTNGIDISNTTFSNSAFISPGFNIGATGGINTGAVGVSSGNITFFGTTSGSIVAGTNSTGNLLTITQPIQVGVIGSVAGQINIAGLTSGSTQLSCSATGGTLQMASGNLTVDASGNIVANGLPRFGFLAAPSAGGTGFMFISSAQVAIGTGTGNPTFSAQKGSLYLENGSGQLWLNTSGSTTWTQITVP